jgi:lysozyme
MRHEGCKLNPYKDTVGVLTIGYGRNLEDKGITKAEALMMLRNDIEDVKASLEPFSWYKKQNPARKRTLVNMCFNLGLSGLLKFKRMIEALERDDYNQAAHEALDSKWAQQVGGRALEIAEVIRNGAD